MIDYDDDDEDRENFVLIFMVVFMIFIGIWGFIFILYFIGAKISLLKSIIFSFLSVSGFVASFFIFVNVLQQCLIANSIVRVKSVLGDLLRL